LFSVQDTEGSKEESANCLDVFNETKPNANSKYTFISTTTRELKSILDEEFDTNVLVGIENFKSNEMPHKKFD
jgi:hypothetical protein